MKRAKLERAAGIEPEELRTIREFYMAVDVDQHDLLPLDVLSRPTKTDQPRPAAAG